jgi:DnaJ-class molecular chaperone
MNNSSRWTNLRNKYRASPNPRSDSIKDLNWAINIMGVGLVNDVDVIKKRWRYLQLKHHPDKNSGCTKSHQRIQDINTAYDILKKNI